MIVVMVGLVCFWTIALVMAAFLFLECVSARLPQPPDAPAAPDLGGVLVLVPAHNEAATLPRCLQSLFEDHVTPDRIIVVANDCTDRTADVAREAGVRVLEYRGAERRLKARGLTAALEAIKAEAPRMVVFVDADSWVQPGSTRALVGAVAATGRPAQAVFLQRSPLASPVGRVSTFTFALRNLVRPLGLRRMGWPCLLYGSGMAVPWRLLDQGFACEDDEPEDYALTVALTLRGEPPVFCPAARLDTLMAADAAGAARQRRAWAARHLRVAVRYGGRLAGAVVRQRSLPVAAVMMEIVVPPLSLFSAAMVVALAASAWRARAGSAMPVLLGSATVVLFIAALGTAWAHVRRDHAVASVLGGTPTYVASQVPAQLTTLLTEIWRGLRRAFGW